MQKRWLFPKDLDSFLVKKLADELQISDAVSSLLIGRGFSSTEEASVFLNPRLALLRPPEEIPGISPAVERLMIALKNKEPILLYGDYDVDGITSLAFLARFLKAAGGIVECFIPERSREGYGLSAGGLARCLVEHHPKLMIVVDCGTNSFEEAVTIHSHGIDLIILDHHEPQSKTAADFCAALINPKIGESYHYLCSVALVFKLCHAFLKKNPISGIDLRHYLDFVALGTVADIVPLVEENRIFVRRGLQRLETSRWAGIKALIAVADIKAPYTAFDIGFKLGPRINASGRLGSAMEALELLLTDNPIAAKSIAGRLDADNRERQNVEQLVKEEAEEWVAANFHAAKTSIVIGKRDWHQGVVGIVASRIAKRWHRPTLIIGIDDKGQGKGSGRSIEGLSLVEALEGCSSLLDAFGGHAMAAGLSLHESKLEKLREVFEKETRRLLTDEDLIPLLKLDAEINLADVSDGWLHEQDQLAPFGPSNPQPIFVARSVRLAKEPRLLKEKHYRFEFLVSQKKSLAAIFFNGAIDPLPPQPWDIAFTIERNTYQGRVSLQLQIIGIRKAEGYSPIL